MAKKVFYVIGDIDFNDVKIAFDKISFKTYKEEQLNFLDLETKQIEKVNEIIEKQANKQSIVLMGYRSEIRENDELYNGMFLLNHMLGGFFHSTLFQEVREKHSLAYSISSDYNSRKGTFVINAGISADKFSKFKNIVNKIIEDYQNGIIDDDTMNLTKKMLINAQYKLADQPSYGASAILKEVANLKEKSPEEKAASIEKITKDEIMRAAKNLKLDTIFMLEGTL
ncbi:MAG: M16 family metallopeptidase [Bacilli bacterium]